MIAMPPQLEKEMEKYKDVFPVPLYDLAHDLGLEIYEATDFPSRKSGSLSLQDGKFKIFVNAKHPLTRKRFTVAHEIGHFVLHRDKLLSQDNQEHIDDVKTPVKELMRDESCELSEEDKEMEIQANEIAAQILMPEEEFKKTFECANDLAEIAQKFKVSEAAVSRRAENLLGVTMM